MKPNKITKPSELVEYRADWIGRIDRRTALWRSLDARLNELYASLGDLNNLTIATRMICERVVFIELQLRDMESCAMDGKEFDLGKHGFLSNVLTGLLTKLGLTNPKAMNHNGMAQAWAKALQADGDYTEAKGPELLRLTDES